MKVCVVSLHYGNAYGQGLCVERIASGLAERGNKVVVIHSTGKPAGKKTRNLREIFLEKINLTGADFLSFGKQLDRKILELDEKEGFDLFYAHSYEFGLLDFNKLKKPFVFHARGTVKGNDLNRPRASGITAIGRRILVPRMIELDRKCCVNAVKVIADSENVKKEITGFYGVSPKKILVVPEGIDLTEFSHRISGEKIRKEFRLENQKVLLFAGRIVPQKGLQFIVEAMPAVLKRFPETALLVAGSNTAENYQKTIKKRINELGITENVVFAGFIEQKKMPEFFAASDIVLSPSTYEPFGIVNLEATAMKKPLITTSCAGSRNAVKKNAVILNKPSPKGIEKAVIELLSKPKKAGNLSAGSRERIKGFEWKKLAARVEKILQGALP